MMQCRKEELRIASSEVSYPSVEGSPVVSVKQEVFFDEEGSEVGRGSTHPIVVSRQYGPYGHQEQRGKDSNEDNGPMRLAAFLNTYLTIAILHTVPFSPVLVAVITMYTPEATLLPFWSHPSQV